MLQANETGISFGHFGLWLGCAFTLRSRLTEDEIAEFLTNRTEEMKEHAKYIAPKSLGHIHVTFEGEAK